MRSRWGGQQWLFFLTLATVVLLGQLLGAQSRAPNYPALKTEMKVLEAVIDQTMARTFTPPFGLLEKTKGTYLPDFGVVFSLEVNLYPVRIPNPFDARPLSQEELDKARKVKRERIGIITQSVPRLLADHASSLREVNPGESVAVVVHLFHFQAESEKLPTQLVLQVKKDDLNQFWEKKLSYQQLVEKVRVIEL